MSTAMNQPGSSIAAASITATVSHPCGAAGLPLVPWSRDRLSADATPANTPEAEVVAKPSRLRRPQTRGAFGPAAVPSFRGALTGASFSVIRAHALAPDPRKATTSARVPIEVVPTRCHALAPVTGLRPCCLHGGQGSRSDAARVRLCRGHGTLRDPRTLTPTPVGRRPLAALDSRRQAATNPRAGFASAPSVTWNTLRNPTSV